MATSSTSSPFSDSDGIWEVDDGLWQEAVPTNTPVSNKTAGKASSHSTPVRSQVDAADEPPQLSPNAAFWVSGQGSASVSHFRGPHPSPISHVSTSSHLASMASPQSSWTPSSACSEDAVETTISSFGDDVSEAGTETTMKPELVETHDQGPTSPYAHNPTFAYAHELALTYANVSPTTTLHYTPMTWSQPASGLKTNAGEESNQETQSEAETSAAGAANSAENNMFQSSMYTYMYPDTNQYVSGEQSYTPTEYTFAGVSNVAQFNPEGYGDSCAGCAITQQNIGGTCVPNTWGHCQYCWRTLWGELWASSENNGQGDATAGTEGNSANSDA